MSHYLVHAQPTGDMEELHERLVSGEFEDVRPFGAEMTHALLNARYDPEKDEGV